MHVGLRAPAFCEVAQLFWTFPIPHGEEISGEVIAGGSGRVGQLRRMTTKDDEQCLKLGREIVRMIRDLQKVSGGETGYARRLFTYPGGEAHVILSNDKRVADLMDAAARKAHEIAEALPPSLQN